MPNYTGIIDNKDVAVKIFNMRPFYGKNPMINWINSSIGDDFFLVPKEIKIRKKYFIRLPQKELKFNGL